MIEEGDKTEYTAPWWVKEVVAAEKELDKDWRTSGDKIVQRYLDVRNDGDALTVLESSSARKYNIFWANTQILKSALYATPPKPTVKRLHDDAKDDAARVGALMLQRILGFGMLRDNSDMHRAFQNATEDRLIPGLGQVWLRLKTKTEQYSLEAISDPMTGLELEPAFQGERIVSQEVCTDYVHWRDFVWSPARVWSEVWWVCRRVWMTKKNFIARFGQEKYDAVKKDITYQTIPEHGYPKGFEKNRIQVLEIWCKETEKAYWIQESTKITLDELEDPLQLRDFFPCPCPILGTHTTNSLVPRPDYAMVQDQYAELDVVNDRISMLTRALRVVGAYDSKNTELAKMVTGAELNMIPVDNWAMLSEAGGMKGAVDWFPVEQVATVLQALVEIRPQIIAQIYELTSISDIMRGGSNPRETLGAQKLKAQYSSVRLRLTQGDVANFVAMAMKIKCEIISKHMDPEQIKKQSAIEYTESAGLTEQGLDFIKNLDANEFRVEITEESLSMADYTAERELRLAYLTAVGQFLSQSAQMTANMPAATPYVIKMIQWVTASFRGSDDIETILDAAADAAKNMPQTPPGEQEKPDKSLEVAQVKAQSDMQIAQGKGQLDMQIAQGTATLDAQTEQAKIASDEKVAMEKIASEERLELAKIALDRENNIRDNQTKLEIADATLELDEKVAEQSAEQAEKDSQRSAAAAKAKTTAKE